jgi:predicted lysophospholipase L1 biosynthesis ABC-type transport system permease subunit
MVQELEIVPTRALKTRALAIFDRSFAITYGLEVIAVLVGLAGVAATTSAQTIARSREFGMLRHLGVTRRQIVAMLGMEGALLGLVGGVAGVALGCVLAQVLIRGQSAILQLDDGHAPALRGAGRCRAGVGGGRLADGDDRRAPGPFRRCRAGGEEDW